MLSSLYYSDNSLPKHSERWFWLCWIQVYYPGTFYFFFSKTDQRVLEIIFNLFSYSYHFLHWSSESIVDFGGFIPVYSRRTISILSIHFVFFVSLVLILAFIVCNWKQLNFSAHTKNTMDYPNRFYFNPLVLWLKFLAC